MSGAIKIKRKDYSTIGRYELVGDNKGPVAVSYTRPRDGEVYLNYAGFHAQSPIAKLIDRLVEDARNEGVQITIMDDKLQSLFEQNPQWADVCADKKSMPATDVRED